MATMLSQKLVEAQEANDTVRDFMRKQTLFLLNDWKNNFSCDKIKYHYNYFLPGVSHRRQASLRQRRAKAAFLPIMQ